MRKIVVALALACLATMATPALASNHDPTTASMSVGDDLVRVTNPMSAARADRNVASSPEVGASSHISAVRSGSNNLHAADGDASLHMTA